MDYHDSSAGSARLAVAKYSATASEKLGTIFFNPGDLANPILGIFPLIHSQRRRAWGIRGQCHCRTRTVA